MNAVGRDIITIPGPLDLKSGERLATEPLSVSYAGRIIEIPAGSRYYVDDSGAVIFGWHRTYDPPEGMCGESMLTGLMPSPKDSV